MSHEIKVTVRDFRGRLSEHVQRVRRGGSVVVTSRGKPVARLVPIEGAIAAPRPFGFMKGRIEIAPDFQEIPAEILQALEADPFPPRRRRRTA